MMSDQPAASGKPPTTALRRLIGLLLLLVAAHGVFQDAADRYGRDVGELHVAKRLEDDAGLSFRMEGDWTAPWDVAPSG